MTQIPFARRSPVSPDTCNLAKAIDLVGDRWTLLILRAALYGVRRFDDFHAELGCPRTVLSGRLKKLVDDGLLDIFDVFAFLNAFNAGSLEVDMNGDGLLDIFDVFEYLDAFNAGCP